MALTPQEIEAAPHVTLGGKRWPVPKLALRQNKQIMPKMIGMLPALSQIIALTAARAEPTEAAIAERAVVLATAAGDESRWAEHVEAAREALAANPASLLNLQIPEDTFDGIVDIVFIALTRGTPDLTREQLLDLDVSPLELFEALGTVLNQTGMVQKAAPGSAPGEAVAANPQTSTH